MELLRDVFVGAYERSTQEYLVIKQDLAEPDPISLAWRDVIKQTVRAVVSHLDDEALHVITQAMTARVPELNRVAVQSLIVDELRRSQEGILTRRATGCGRQRSGSGRHGLKTEHDRFKFDSCQ